MRPTQDRRANRPESIWPISRDEGRDEAASMSMRSIPALRPITPMSTPQIILEQLLNGLSIGALYALVTAGLALTVSVLGVVNFAHGDLFTVGAFIFFGAYITLGLSYVVAAVVTIIAMVVVGAVFSQVVIRPVVHRRWQVQLLATVAASTVINNSLIWWFGSIPRSTPTTLASTDVHFLGLSMSWQRVLIIVASLLAFGALHVFLTHSRTGRAMRAISQNRDAAQAAGIDLKRISLVTFILGTGLIGLGDVLVTPVYTVFPTMGVLLTLKGFAVLVVAGFGRVDGAIAGAFLLGIAEAMGTQFISSSYTDAYAFLAMVLVLLVRPRGLFARRVGI